MSSEAAYFPDALANTPEIRGSAQGAAAIASDPPDSVRYNPSETSSSTLIPIAEISDEALLEQVRQGRREALGILFRRHARSVRNVAFRVLRNEAEADDLAQEVFLFIFRKAALFDPAHGGGRSWIFQVAYHRAFDRRRYLNSRHFYASQEIETAERHLAGPRVQPVCNETSMEGIFGKQLTARFNARLTPEQRETIQLFFFEGYTLREIALRTGRSLVNVRSHYYRGLDRLRQYVLHENLRST